MITVCSPFWLESVFLFWQSLASVLCRWVALMRLHWISCHWLQRWQGTFVSEHPLLHKPILQLQKLGSSLPSSCGCFGCVILPIFLIRSICCKCDGLQNMLLSQFGLQQLCGSGYYRGSFAENLCWLCKRYHQLSAICCCNWSGYDYNLLVDSTISNQSPEWLCAVGLWLWEECPASLTSSQFMRWCRISTWIWQKMDRGLLQETIWSLH